MANSTTLYTGADGRIQVDVTENKTLALTDCGVVQNVITDALTITLPATAAANSFTVRNGGVPASSGVGAGTGAGGSVLVSIAPNASDKVQGLGFSASDNKAINNTKATSNVGDEIQLVGDGVDGYNVVRAKGTWVRAS
jgi:hypothetical protein